MAEEAAAGYLDGRIDAVRQHLAEVVVAAPNLPAELARVGEQLALEWQTRGQGTVLMLIAGLLTMEDGRIRSVLGRWGRQQSPPHLSNHMRRDIGLDPLPERRDWIW